MSLEQEAALKGNYPPGQHPDLPPPSGTVGVIGWMRKNLFGSILDSVATLGILYAAYLLLVPFANWFAVDAVFSGTNRLTCDLGKTGGLLKSYSTELATRLERAPGILTLSDPTPDEELEKRRIERAFSNYVFAVERFEELYETSKTAEINAARAADALAVAVATDDPDLNRIMAEARARENARLYRPVLDQLLILAEPIPFTQLAESMRTAWAAGDLDTVLAAEATLQPLIEWGDRYDGACWTAVKSRVLLFFVGAYDRDKLWRPALAGILLIVALLPILVLNLPRRKLFLLFSAAYPVIAFYLLYGGPGLTIVDTTKWGGLLVNLVAGTFGMFVAMVLGIVLALGRRSSMPVIKSLSIVYIEFIRGVPLITVLFMSSVLFPLFLPGDVTVDKLLRACIGFGMFGAAYMAEVVRGGLQAIPKGQFEAADALGLSYLQSMRLIVLPQALKIVIPAIVNTFVSLFKDTSLMQIIGILEILKIAQVTNLSSEWVGFNAETYTFTAIIFLIICYSMSHYSIYLERKLDTGHKKKL